MRKYGIVCPKGVVARTPEDAERAAKEIGSQDVAVKAQILAGGRGMGTFDNGFKGGVHLCTSPVAAKEIAAKMLGHKLITKQTGAQGRIVNTVYIMERVYLRKEMYFAILMDRKAGGPVLVGSPKGGMDIEAVAANTPEFIFTQPIDINKGMSIEQGKALAAKIGFSESAVPKAAEQMQKLYELFIKTDATLVEINPFAETPDGNVLCVDAKLNFDDNAAFRQPEIHALRDTTQEDAREVKAEEFGLNYVGLDGNIGCMVNGAGLAMATMDIIKLTGGNPANFLDVGGGVNTKSVTEAFKILNDDPQVEAILVNVFGGIVRCDIIADGIIEAAKIVDLRVPVVVRLQGTNAEVGKEKIASSGLQLSGQDDLEKAATLAVGLAELTQKATSLNLKVSFVQ